METQNDVTRGEPTDLGRRIRQLREARGLSRVKLGRLTEIDPDAIYNIETGVSRSMHSRNLQRVADALGTTVGYLLTGYTGDEEGGSEWLRDNVTAWARTYGDLTDEDLLGLLDESYRMLKDRQRWRAGQREPDGDR